MIEKNLDVQMEEAAKALLKEITTGKGDMTLQEKASAFKVVTAYYALLRKEPLVSDEDDEDREPTIHELAGSLHGQNGVQSRRG
ncbi:MAG TPA: hypothetical protein VLJ17_24835 [Xanthobacteraceae bacterium]|nr:hypothetical protein [Xanthobacteraceae bacterium]